MSNLLNISNEPVVEFQIAAPVALQVHKDRFFCEASHFETGLKIL